MKVTFATLRSREVVSFGVMYVSASLKQAGHEVNLIEADDAGELVANLRRRPADVLCFSVTTGLHGTYLAWAAAAKNAVGVTTVFGGPHPTFFPELIDQPQVDAIVIGEGEQTAPELLDALQVGDGRGVLGARYRLEGAIISAPLRRPEQDLDRLALPDRRLYFNLHRFHRRFAVRSLVASRGCPYGCTYCFNRTLREMYRGMGKPVRFRSPAAIIDEIQFVRRNWRTEVVWFLDANLAVRRSWLEELCDRLARGVKLPFYCKVRPNVVNERLARTLARGGCSGVGLGIEAGDDDLRRTVLERRVSREQILAACQRLRSHGIRVMSFNMVGLPGETYEMARATVDLNIDAGVDYAMTMVFQPYPRTRLTEYAVDRGLFDGDFDALDDNYYATTALRQSRAGDRLRIENLQRVFALAVEFPEVRSRLDQLVEQRLPRLYGKLFELWHYHCFNRRFYGGQRLAPRARPRRPTAPVRSAP